jgi:hypothetical protein
MVALSATMIFGVLLLAAATAVACESPATVEFRQFSFLMPAPGPWVLDQAASDETTSVFVINRGKANYRITMLESFIADEAMLALPASQVADDFRNAELDNMKARGVRPGLYKLKKVAMGEKTIGDKRFYTMTYSTKSKVHYESARLYVYFPGETGNVDFLIAHYSEVAPTRDDLSVSYLADFLNLLETIVD